MSLISEITSWFHRENTTTLEDEQRLKTVTMLQSGNDDLVGENNGLSVEVDQNTKSQQQINDALQSIAASQLIIIELLKGIGE